MNHHSGLRASKVARLIGIPRPTAYRLLETLEGMGFVARGSSQDSWRPTLKTKSLSSGFRDEDWVAQIAVPPMMKLGRQILWPLDLVTFTNYRMLIRESTHNISPFSVDHGMVGRELPVLETAGGRAYLAFVSSPERQHILSGLRSELGNEKVDYHKDGPLSLILKRTLDLGVGFRVKGFQRSDNEHLSPDHGPRKANWLSHHDLDRFGDEVRQGGPNSQRRADRHCRGHIEGPGAAVGRNQRVLPGQPARWGGATQRNSGRAERKPACRG